MMCVDVQNVYKVKKEQMLLGKKIMFIASNFDINIHHPYKPLMVVTREF
jgi:hypothetical protein